MDRRFLPAFLLFGLFLAIVILYEYGESFSFYFVGDDFAFIEYVLTEKAAIFWKPSCFYHFCPLGLFLITLPANFSIFEPAWFAAVGFVFFLSTSLLIMEVYRKVAGGLFGGFLAALLFATAVPNSEVIYWKTGTSTIAMTFFSLVSFLFYTRYLEKRSVRWFLATIAAFAVSILSMEQGTVTFGFLFLYDLLFQGFPKWKEATSPERKRELIPFAVRNLILLLLPISMMMYKRSLGADLGPFSFSQLFGLVPHLTRETLIRLFNFNRLHLPFLTSNLSVWLVVLALLVLFFVYIYIRKTAAGLFFLLGSIGSILTLSLVAGGPNERYFCLPLVYFSCFLSLFFRDVSLVMLRPIAKKSSTSEVNHSRTFFGGHNVLSVTLILAVAAAGFSGNVQRRTFWAAASKIERNIVKTVEDTYLAGSFSNGGGKKMYLINIPEYFVTGKDSIFYVSSNSLMPDLRHRLPEAADNIELAATAIHFGMDVNSEPVKYRALGRQNPLDRKRINQLQQEGHTMFQFSPALMDIIPVGAS